MTESAAAETVATPEVSATAATAAAETAGRVPVAGVAMAAPKQATAVMVVTAPAGVGRPARPVRGQATTERTATAVVRQPAAPADLDRRRQSPTSDRKNPYLSGMTAVTFRLSEQL